MSQPVAPTVPVVAPTRSRAATLVGAIFIFMMASYAFSASADIFSTGDTTIRIELAENILGRFSVVLHGWKLQYPKHIKKEFFDPRISAGRGGYTYSTYELGQPIAIMPFDKLGEGLAIVERWPYGPTVQEVDRLVGPLFGALLAVVFFLFAIRLGYGLPVSLLLTAIFGFATAAWPDEQSVLEHTEVSFSLLLGMYYAFRFKEQGKPPHYLVLCGAAVGIALSTRYQDAFLGIVAITVYLLLPGGTQSGFAPRLRWIGLAGIGMLPFALVDGWYSWYRFGAPLASGHHETVFGYPIWLGAAGLLISPGKGLLWYSPTIFLLALAARPFYRRYSALAISFWTLSILFVLLYAYVNYWHGDPAWGPRYIYPTLPFLTLPLGELFRVRWKRTALVWIVTALVVLASFGIQVAAVSVSQWRTWYRVIQYEERQGYQWEWIASRYRYFWNPHESPLYLQVHGLYQMTYDTVRDSNKYNLVPPDEDAVLTGLTNDFAINQWNFWWTSNEFNWWMGEKKVLLGVAFLLSLMLASGVYIASEAAGVWATQPSAEPRMEPVPEAA